MADKPTRNKGGRPKLSDDQLRRHEVKIRLTDAEFERLTIDAERANMSLAEFARVATLGKRITVIERAEFSPSFMQAFALYGSNLNQLAKHANAGRGVTATTIQIAVKEWQELREAIRASMEPKP